MIFTILVNFNEFITSQVHQMAFLSRFSILNNFLIINHKQIGQEMDFKIST